MHEQSFGNIEKARELLNKAIELDSGNGYVCHSYGLLEMQSGDWKRARQLWQQGLTKSPSAALICSLGNLYTTQGHPESARELYSVYLPQLPSGREKVEVHLAASSLEETVFGDLEKASELLKVALSDKTMQDSRAYMALARLGTSGGRVDDRVVKKRLQEICSRQLKAHHTNGQRGALFPVKDGRLFNAWAKLETKTGSLSEARDILKKGMLLYPKDHTVSLIVVAGVIFGFIDQSHSEHMFIICIAFSSSWQH
jgi:tetratricopeptide (TPR) repeat protein